PDAEIQFFDGSNLLASLLLMSGGATTPISGLAPGLHLLTASFAGGSGFLPSASLPFFQFVNILGGGNLLLPNTGGGGGGGGGGSGGGNAPSTLTAGFDWSTLGSFPTLGQANPHL